ncbi:MAG: amidohydrolase [Prevotella sp.]|jgi:omega-amidase|nr:amidohydrolase [Prevotella sp.]MCI1282832.1 amidohydrolase [Prevotella sp.]
MKITTLQRDILWAQPAANVKRTEEAIRQLPDADLFILPEMFSTGFATQPEGIAENDHSDTLAWMKSTAAARNCAICGSILVKSGDRFYNRFYFVEPDGKVTTYDKRHLFTYGGEDKFITAGEERVIVTFRGIRILLEVCYDLRFPVWSRNRNDYDLALYVASWPKSRIDAWSTLLKARAIENQCYVAGVNRVGNDPSCEYNGCSAILDPYGHTLAACEPNQEMAATADIDLEILHAFRAKFPVLNDADDFMILKNKQ